MFKKFVAIALAALVAASVVTGCGNNAGNTASVASSKDSRLKPKYPFENFLVHDKDKKEEGYAGSFDLYSALQQYGATDMYLTSKYYSDDYPTSVDYAVKFSNGDMVTFSFVTDLSKDPSVMELSFVNIYKAEQDYIPPNYDDFQRNTKCSKWKRYMRVRNPEEMQMGEDYYETHNMGDKENWFVIPTGNLTGDGEVENRTFVVKSYFDEVFNSSIAPYLQLEDTPWDKDPFLKNPKVLGKSKYVNRRDAYNK